MRDHEKPGVLALRILAASRVVELRDSADELTKIVAALKRPIPIMPTDPRERRLQC